MEPFQYIPSYIESLTTLLVFGITLPTIFINIPSRQRSIGNRHLPWARFGIQYTSFRVVVWGCAVASIIFLAGFLVTTPSWICNGRTDGLLCKILEWCINHVAYIAFAVLAFNIILVVLYGFFVLAYTKIHLLSYLVNTCQKQAQKQNRSIDKAILESLGELGTFCDAGRDKESVLDALKQLANFDLSFDTRAILSSTIRKTVIGGNSHNHIDAMDILQQTFRVGSLQQIEANQDSNQRDLFLAEILLELKNVMMAAYSLEDRQVTASIMTGYDELATQAATAFADSFMDLGKTALSMHEMEQALTILDKFDTKIDDLLNRVDDSDGEAVHVYFGLVAHFWHTGNTARHHAMKYLNDLKDIHSWKEVHLDERLIAAHKHYELIDLETADYLEQMMYEIKQRRLVRAHLKKIGIIDQAIVMRILTNFPSIKHLKKADRDSLNACGLDEDNAQKLIRSLQ